jgi:hypothetical protein
MESKKKKLKLFFPSPILKKKKKKKKKRQALVSAQTEHSFSLFLYPFLKILTIEVHDNGSQQKDTKDSWTNTIIVCGALSVSNLGSSPVESIKRIHHHTHCNDCK